jgi:hypothetical protein
MIKRFPLSSEELYGPKSVWTPLYFKDIVYQDIDFMIDLPEDMLFFKPHFKLGFEESPIEESPIFKLFELIVEESPSFTKLSDLDVTKIVLSPSSFEIVNKYSYFWLTRVNRDYAQATLQYKLRHWAMFDLNYGVNCSNSVIVKDTKCYYLK